MSNHSFVTELELTTRLGVVTDVIVTEEIVNIPTNSEIRRIATETIKQFVRDIALRDRKLDKAAEQAKSAAKEAARQLTLAV